MKRVDKKIKKNNKRLIEKNITIPINENSKENIKNVLIKSFDKIELSKEILKVQPIYYDNSEIWWLWNKEKNCWDMTNQTDLLNIIRSVSDSDTIDRKERDEIIEALKQEARLHKPKKIKNTWIQFQKEIYDIETGKKFEATPEFFVTNPIPYKLDKNNKKDTPIMDKIFKEWVGEKYISTLYEIIAYCLISDYPIHRVFCLLGSGLNGKSKFLNLLKKFIGQDNTCSTDLDLILTSRFEVIRLYKKLICLMGETEFRQMSKTAMLKKLSGQDLIGFEFKGKDLFQDTNYAKIIIATNNLPMTDDKSIGFYRRWLIIDFPNQFTEKKDILADIPEEEYERLAVKSCEILKIILKTREFSNEGTIEERIKNFEEKSNPFKKFIEHFCTLDNEANFIWKNKFERKFNEWCKEHRFRQFSEDTINENMKKITEIKTGRKYFQDRETKIQKQGRVWLGIGWKDDPDEEYKDDYKKGSGQI